MASAAPPSSKPPARTRNLEQAAKNFNLPLQAKIWQVLRERALHDFAHSQQFYSERDLIEKLGVSQPTVRRVLSGLVGEGYLVADARRGCLVHHHSPARYVGLVSPVWHSYPYGSPIYE